MMPSIADLCVGIIPACASIEMAQRVMLLSLDVDEPPVTKCLADVPPPKVVAPKLSRREQVLARQNALMSSLRKTNPVSFFSKDLELVGVSTTNAHELLKQWERRKVVSCVGWVIVDMRRGHGKKKQYEWCK